MENSILTSRWMTRRDRSWDYAIKVLKLLITDEYLVL